MILQSGLSELSHIIHRKLLNYHSTAANIDARTGGCLAPIGRIMALTAVT